MSASMPTTPATFTQDRLLRGVAALLGVCLVLFILLKTRNAAEEYNYIGKQVRDRDVITIAGEGKVESRPDVARITLGVITDGKTVKEIQRTNTDKMNAVIAAMKALGIEAKDIQTSSFNLSPQYDWNDGRQTLRGYQISQQVTVKIRDLDKAGEALARAGELGTNSISGPEFVIDDPTALREQARVKAIADAQKKAQALADQLGLKIVKVISFSESSGGAYPVPQPMYYKAVAMDARAEAAPAANIEAGSMDIHSDVSVTFEVR